MVRVLRLFLATLLHIQVLHSWFSEAKSLDARATCKRASRSTWLRGASRSWWLRRAMARMYDIPLYPCLLISILIPYTLLLTYIFYRTESQQQQESPRLFLANLLHIQELHSQFSKSKLTLDMRATRRRARRGRWLRRAKRSQWSRRALRCWWLREPTGTGS